MNRDIGTEMFNNNPITGQIADLIIELSEMKSIFLEVLRHFRS
jgi:hypothetical protein